MKTSKDRLGVKIAESGNSPLSNYTVHVPTGAICQTGCTAHLGSGETESA